MAKKIRFSEAIEDYFEYCYATGKRLGTIRTREVVLYHALQTIGNLYVDSIEQRHIVTIMTSAGRTRSQATMVNNHSTLRTFFTWAAQQKYIGKIDDPMVGYPRP